jgi:hypothetical protein
MFCVYTLVIHSLVKDIHIYMGMIYSAAVG